jgi:hypothetical protein
MNVAQNTAENNILTIMPTNRQIRMRRIKDTLANTTK